MTLLPRSLSLWDFQEESLNLLHAGLARGVWRQILTLPTGGGKTECAVALAIRALGKGSRVLFIADRLALIDQAADRFDLYGVPHGRIQAGKTRDSNLSVQVASAQTLEKRGWWVTLDPKKDVVIIDEAHIQRAQITAFLKWWTGAVVGLTATPQVDGLGDIYQGIIAPTTTNRLIQRKFLTPLKFYTARAVGAEIDMTGAKKVGGEWTAKEVRHRSRPIIGDIVSEWYRHTHMAPEDGGFGGPVPTLVFSADIEQGQEICKAFKAAGFDFRQTTHLDSLDETRAIIADFRDGKFPGLVSVEKLAKGFDVPEVRAMVGARPYYSSLAALLQQLGRGMRITPDGSKDFCIYLDHAGNIEGWWDEIQNFWQNSVKVLQAGKDKNRPKRKEGGERADVVCLRCGLIVTPGTKVCPGCGETRPAPNRRRSRTVTVPGYMQEMKGDMAWASDRSWVWREICTVVGRMTQDPAKRMSMAKSHYKTLTGVWPPWNAPYAPRTGWPDRRVKDTVYQQAREFRRERKKAVEDSP